jgi:hypothetical protein
MPHCRPASLSRRPSCRWVPNPMSWRKRAAYRWRIALRSENLVDRCVSCPASPARTGSAHSDAAPCRRARLLHTLLMQPAGLFLRTESETTVEPRSAPHSRMLTFGLPARQSARKPADVDLSCHALRYRVSAPATGARVGRRSDLRRLAEDGPRPNGSILRKVARDGHSDSHARPGGRRSAATRLRMVLAGDYSRHEAGDVWDLPPLLRGARARRKTA